MSAWPPLIPTSESSGKNAPSGRLKLVMVDPFPNYLGSANLFKEQEVRKVLARVVRLAGELDVTFVLIMHNSKQTGRTALMKVIGAVGNVGVGRIGWSFVKSEKDPENLKEMLLMKENLGKFPGLVYTTESVELEIAGEVTQQARIKYVESTDRSADDATAQAEDPERKKLSRAEQIVRQHMPADSDQWVSSKRIADKLHKVCSFDHHRRQALREELGIEANNIGGVWHWRWKPEQVAAAEQQQEQQTF